MGHGIDSGWPLARPIARSEQYVSLYRLPLSTLTALSVPLSTSVYLSLPLSPPLSLPPSLSQCLSLYLSLSLYTARYGCRLGRPAWGSRAVVGGDFLDGLV